MAMRRPERSDAIRSSGPFNAFQSMSASASRTSTMRPPKPIAVHLRVDRARGVSLSECLIASMSGDLKRGTSPPMKKHCGGGPVPRAEPGFKQSLAQLERCR
jgi:hypothetical protein